MTAPALPTMPRWDAKQTLLDRFGHNVIPEPMSGCHLWIGCINGDGYGSVRLNGRRISAHRAAWEEAHGDIPHGLWVLHRCDNPPCVNPAHLFLGTAKDNAVDMAKKKRCHNVRAAAEDRFRSFVRHDTATGCLVWTGTLSRDGFGRFKVWPQSFPAHRFAWARDYGPIPDGEHVRQRCGNKACVNTAHLFLSDQSRLVGKGKT